MNDNQQPSGDVTAAQPAIAAKGIELVYVADPMCSWCYGFAPTIAAIARQFDGRMPVWPLMGGLRAGNSAAMSDKDKDYVREHWGHVTQMTGRPFDYGFFDRQGFVYDTEPACRAVVTMRIMAPERAMDYLERVSTAFYAEGRDTTKAGVLIDLAEEMGAERARFERGFALPEVRDAAARDFSSARQLGVRGFPSLLAGNDDIGYTLLSNGYIGLKPLSEQLEGWYSSQVS